MKQLLFVLFFVPAVVKAQSQSEVEIHGPNGIKFEQGLSWEQILQKAKKQNKYIFVDCYTTWCGPCKVMEQRVYSSKNVGANINEKFITLKLQMDTSKKDNDEVRQFYGDAHNMMQQYKITSFPTFLFFSPNGRIVHRGVGYKKEEDFIELASNAVDRSKQVYVLLENYKKGKRDYANMPYLANSTKSLLNEKALAITIAQDYLQNYLYKLREDDLLKKENVEFMATFIQSSKEKAFNVFYTQAGKVDEITRIGYSQSVVDYIITKEEINPKLWHRGQMIAKPNWNKITSGISKKYNTIYADRTVINAQLEWYGKKKDWAELAKYNVNKIERFGLDTTGIGKNFTNNMIWEVIFEHCNDKEIINKAILWMEVITNADPNDNTNIDTYANLLYKIGRTKEAIEFEEKAVKLENQHALKFKRTTNKIFQETLEKMKKGLPTWPVE